MWLLDTALTRTNQSPAVRLAETKEQLLGFVLIEAKDHYEAVEVASRIPLARLGSIEVRSIVDLAR